MRKIISRISAICATLGAFEFLLEQRCGVEC